MTILENDGYDVFVYEIDAEIHVSFLRKELKYPDIFVRGINVAATGTMPLIELDKHLELIQIAKETLKQVNERFKDYRIRQY